MNSSSVNTLFKKFWDWRLKEFPEFATFVGIHDYDGKLQSYALESIHERKVKVEKYLNEASQLNSEPSLSKEDKLNLEYFISDLSDFVTGYELKGYYFPLCYLDGVHIEFARLLEAMKQEKESDYLKILERLTNLPQQISEIIDIMREGIKNKMTFHSISISNVLKQLDELQVSAEDTIFYKPFASIPDDASFEIRSKLEIQKEAAKVIEENVLPAFRNLRNFLENEYFKHLRADISISSLFNGEKYYQTCLRYHISCNMTPKEIHQKGLEEVDRISKKMLKIIEDLKLKMSLKEFADHLKGNKDFYYKNVEEVLETFRDVLFNTIEPKLNKLFSYKPKSKLVIKPMPSSIPNAPSAYYYAGSFDGSKPGTFALNTTDLDSLASFNVMTLALHEGMPGHHFQVYFLIESEGIPDFRKYLEDRRYTEAPALFPLHTAYAEGWALYCEHLGYELGLYEDVYAEYGHLSDEMLRACRLVVDTGIHAFGWCRDKAIDYMLSYTTDTKFEVENEVNRYITWPGQACGYKIGELKIKSLREQSEKALGSKFDVRKFHEVILKSFGPLDVMEKRILEFIEENKGA